MSKTVSRVCVVLLALLLPAAALAQDAQVIDLNLAAHPAGTDKERPVEPGLAFRVRVTNRAPKHDYTINARRETIPVDVLPMDALSRTQSRAPARPGCQGVLETLGTRVFAAETEVEVATAIRDQRIAAATADCTPAQLDAFEGLVRSATTDLLGVVVLSRGERYIVEVSRADGDETITWRLTLTTGARGTWLSTYGVGFLPNEDELYYSQKTGDDQFQVSRQTDAGGLSYVPAIFFSWMPSRWANSSWAISPCGGLGFELTDPVVFAGASISYNTNLHLIVGAAFHSQKRLNGQYEEGQTIKESLTPDQLTQTTFKPNVFFSVAFRFGSNPFSSE